jgi:hypothetical protein
MVVPIKNPNVISVLDHHSVRGWNTTTTYGSFLGETGRQGTKSGTAREGHTGRSNSTASTARPSPSPSPSQVHVLEPTQFVTLILASTPLVFPLRLSESTQGLSAPSPITSSRQTPSSEVLQRPSIAQNTSRTTSISTPIFTMFAASGRTYSASQRPASATASLSRSILTSVPQLATPSAVPAAQSAKPFPGRNQPKPTLDAAAVVSLLQPLGAQSSPVFITSQSLPSQQTSLTTTSLAFRILPSTIQISVSAPFSLSSPATLPSISSPTSFVTLTKSQRGKEQASNVLSALSTSEVVSIPQAVSTLLASTLLIPSMTIASSATTSSSAPQITLTAASGQSQRGGRLTPLARILFIVLGALGQSTQT